MHHLEFEKPIAELHAKIEELRTLSDAEGGAEMSDDIIRLEKKADKTLTELYKSLSAAQKVQVSRHPARPHFKDYISNMIDDFTPLAGDRLYGEDHALVGGLGRFRGRSCVILGQEKGDDTQSRIKHNFGMSNPEGYRKSQRLMDLADRFDIPVITLVDTAGAYPGLGAEERGQSEAIAKSIEKCLRLSVPIISTIIGEGGSGGAIAIASANKVYMLENSIYSIISPEGCASILWRSAEFAKEAAEALKLTAQDLEKLNIIDDIIPEPIGGAHRDHTVTIKAVGDQIESGLKDMDELDGATIKSRRHQRFLEIGQNL